MKRSSELKEAKLSLVKQMRALHQKAEKEDRAFHDPEQRQYDELKKQVLELEGRITRAAELEAAELEAAARNATPIGDTPKPKAEWRTTTGEAVQYRNARNNVRFMERLIKKEQNLFGGRIRFKSNEIEKALEAVKTQKYRR